MKRIIGKILYFIASNLPASHSVIKFGQRNFRASCGKLILSKCGKNINIENGAYFSQFVEVVYNINLGRNCRING